VQITGCSIALIAVGALSFYLYFNEKANTKLNLVDFYVINYFYDEDDNGPWKIQSSQEALDCSWEINPSSTKYDSLLVSFTNNSPEKLFYLTWGTPLSRLHISLIIENKTMVDTINLNNFSCYTGVHPFPISSKETISKKIRNPVYQFIQRQIDSTWTPSNFRENAIVTVGIKPRLLFKHAIYCPFWANQKSQMVVSSPLIVDINEMLNATSFYRLIPNDF
jgi:hypothetical protein